MVIFDQQCTKCKELKTLDDFEHRANRLYRRTHCKMCRVAYNQDYRKNGRLEESATRQGSKICSKCGLEQHVDFFHSDHGKPHGAAQCKKCKADYQRHSRQFYVSPSKTTSERQRAYNLRANFGLEPEDYNVMLANQHGVCAICRNHERVANRKLAVDHDHVTNEIRGLLCFSCNNGIGKFGDSIELLHAAIKYLEGRR